MLLLGPIVFVGIVGTHHDAVEHQLAPSLEKAGITELAIPDDERAAIVKHTAASKKLVKSLHVGGVVAGQLAGSGSSRTFRVVIYDGEGNLTTDLESPIAAAGLNKAGIQMFEANIADVAASGTPAPAPARTAKAGTAKAGKRKAAAVDDSPLPASHTDDDAPPGFAGAPKADPSPRVAAAAPADDDESTAAGPTVVEKSAPATGGAHRFHVEVGLLAGVVGRNLGTDPNTVKTYNASPVGTAGFGGMISIGDRLHIAGSFEHTLVMHTAVGSDNSSTMIGRAEAYASYDLIHGSLALGPAVGFGERYFSIDSTSTARSPDFDYQYVLVGGAVAKQLGTRWTLRGLAAFEPVVGGLVPPMMPEPGRWGVDFGAALEVKATAHVFARASFDYQVFQLTWMQGNAVDGYPSGSAVAGATF